MSRHGRELLLKVFRTWQENPDAARQISTPITRASALPYFEAGGVEAKEELHALLRNAEHSGCIVLTWGRFAKSHLLERITLLDGSQLATFLGLPLASVQADTAGKILRSELSGDQPWIGNLLDEILNLWHIGKPAHGLRVEQVQETRELFRALEAVCAGKQDGCDMRTFSARHVGDSKAVEKMQSRFARIWQRQFGGDDLDPGELYESLGISKFPHPLLFKGAITIVSGDEPFNCTKARPYIGFPPQAIEKLEFIEIPSYVLTVENFASFNRYAAEVSDNGLVIYTGGFPSPSKARLFKMLDAELPETVEFYHWGDLDLGGLRIVVRLQNFMRRKVRPHLMNRELLELSGDSNDKISKDKLLALAGKHSWVMPFVESILSFEPPRTLEQENIDPESPISL
jgi:Wadjet anti plasmid transformation system JetA-like protein